MLGGRAAESVVFNRITTGAQNDLEKVRRTLLQFFEIFDFVGHEAGVCPSKNIWYERRGRHTEFRTDVGRRARVTVHEEAVQSETPETHG